MCAKVNGKGAVEKGLSRLINRDEDGGRKFEAAWEFSWETGIYGTRTRMEGKVNGRVAGQPGVLDKFCSAVGGQFTYHVHVKWKAKERRRRCLSHPSSECHSSKLPRRWKEYLEQLTEVQASEWWCCFAGFSVTLQVFSHFPVGWSQAEPRAGKQGRYSFTFPQVASQGFPRLKHFTSIMKPVRPAHLYAAIAVSFQSWTPDVFEPSQGPAPTATGLGT